MTGNCLLYFASVGFGFFIYEPFHFTDSRFSGEGDDTLWTENLINLGKRREQQTQTFQFGLSLFHPKLSLFSHRIWILFPTSLSGSFHLNCTSTRTETVSWKCTSGRTVILHNCWRRRTMGYYGPGVKFLSQSPVILRHFAEDHSQGQ